MELALWLSGARGARHRCVRPQWVLDIVEHRCSAEPVLLGTLVGVGTVQDCVPAEQVGRIAAELRHRLAVMELSQNDVGHEGVKAAISRRRSWAGYDAPIDSRIPIAAWP